MHKVLLISKKKKKGMTVSGNSEGRIIFSMSPFRLYLIETWLVQPNLPLVMITKAEMCCYK